MFASPAGVTTEQPQAAVTPRTWTGCVRPLDGVVPGRSESNLLVAIWKTFRALGDLTAKWASRVTDYQSGTGSLAATSGGRGRSPAAEPRIRLRAGMGRPPPVVELLAEGWSVTGMSRSEASLDGKLEWLRRPRRTRDPCRCRGGTPPGTCAGPRRRIPADSGAGRSGSRCTAGHVCSPRCGQCANQRPVPRHARRRQDTAAGKPHLHRVTGQKKVRSHQGCFDRAGTNLGPGTLTPRIT